MIVIVMPGVDSPRLFLCRCAASAEPPRIESEANVVLKGGFYEASL